MLAARLYGAGFYKRYHCFFTFLVFETLRDVALTPLPNASAAYQIIWVFTEPLEWMFYVLVVLEIYEFVLHEYRGLATVGRYSLLTAIGVAMAAASLTLLAPSHAPERSPLMSYYYVAERAASFSFAIFLITNLALVMHYPIVLPRNIIVHSIIFSA